MELRKTLTESDISHLSINDVGTYIHAQIDDHIDNGLIHFTKGSIDHTGIFNIGTNAHTQIDAHIAGTGAAVHGDTHLQNTGDTSTGDYTFDGKVGIGIVPTENFHVYKANDIAFKTEVDKTTNTFFSGIRMEFVDSKDGGTTGF
ncbi:MAG TPA: hypothetical protein ENG93_03340, partial [Nitrospirae bacterium]|nr:hypothetical protein [Nitrospirota bacterium]